MQSAVSAPPSVRQFVCFHCRPIFWTEWPLTLIFCIGYTPKHSCHNHTTFVWDWKSRSQVKAKGQNAVDATSSEDSSGRQVYCIYRSHLDAQKCYKKIEQLAAVMVACIRQHPCRRTSTNGIYPILYNGPVDIPSRVTWFHMQGQTRMGPRN